jgi:hypothetical protein
MQSVVYEHLSGTSEMNELETVTADRSLLQWSEYSQRTSREVHSGDAAHEKHMNVCISASRLRTYNSPFPLSFDGNLLTNNLSIPLPTFS